MKITKIDATVCYEFRTIQEFIQYLDKTPNNALFQRRGVYSSQVRDFNSKLFTKTESFQQAQELLLNGWESGTQELKKHLTTKAIDDNKTTLRPVYDVVGYQASIPRYLHGVPTAMVNKKPVVQKQRVITLIKGVSYPGKTSSDQIMKFSSDFVQYAQTLESQGCRTNLFVVLCIESNGQERVCKVKIKDAGERFNLSKLSYPLAHPSFLRRQLFRFIEVCPDITEYGFTRAYGYPKEELIRKFLTKQEVFIPALATKEDIEKLLKGVKTR